MSMPVASCVRHRCPLVRAWIRPAYHAALAVALGLGPALAAPPAPPAAPKLAAVPFQMLPSNHMLVDARINGKGPYRLIFDLGAPITLLSNRAAEGSGVVQANAPRHFLFAIRGEAEVGRLQVGELTVKDLPVIVLDHPALRILGDELSRPIDGIIGYTFFARYRTTIDYQARRMTFEPVDGHVGNLMRDLPDRLLRPKVERHRVLVPGGLWGLILGEPAGGLDAPGVPIRSVLADSPAAAAGLRPGDILTALDGRWTTSVADTFVAASGVPAGRAVPVAILRDGHELTVTVTPRAGL